MICFQHKHTNACDILNIETVFEQAAVSRVHFLNYVYVFRLQRHSPFIVVFDVFYSYGIKTWFSAPVICEGSEFNCFAFFESSNFVRTCKNWFRCYIFKICSVHDNESRFSQAGQQGTIRFCSLNNQVLTIYCDGLYFNCFSGTSTLFHRILDGLFYLLRRHRSTIVEFNVFTDVEFPCCRVYIFPRICQLWGKFHIRCYNG